MKLAVALILVSLLCGGCATVDVSGVGWHLRGTYVMKDPKLDGLKVTPLGVTAADYGSTSRVTGADLVNLAAIGLKMLALLP